MSDADDIPMRLRALIERVVKHPEIKGVVVLVVPGKPGLSDVEVFGFGPAVEEGATVDRILDVAKEVIRAH